MFGKTKVKTEISSVGGDTDPNLSGLQAQIKLFLLSLLESFSSLCCFSAMQAPNGLRSIKLTAFSKAVQYLRM